MFRNKILPVLGAAVTLVLVLGFFPRNWLLTLGLSELIVGIIVVGTALVSAVIVERLLRPAKV